MTADHASEKATTREEVLRFLRSHHMGVLSTVSQDGKPWGAAIYFLVDDELTFYFVTRAETYKYKNLEDNPYVALTIADEPGQTTVQLAGKVTPLPFEHYQEIVFREMPKQIKPEGDETWEFPIDKLKAGDFMPMVLTPDKLQFADYKHVKPEKHADYIEHII
jgi:uncharacterized pyridoxamine 5'-phosphate oxidase family protein